MPQRPGLAELKSTSPYLLPPKALVSPTSRASHVSTCKSLGLLHELQEYIGTVEILASDQAREMLRLRDEKVEAERAVYRYEADLGSEEGHNAAFFCSTELQDLPPRLRAVLEDNTMLKDVLRRARVRVKELEAVLGRSDTELVAAREKEHDLKQMLGECSRSVGDLRRDYDDARQGDMLARRLRDAERTNAVLTAKKMSDDRRMAQVKKEKEQEHEMTRSMLADVREHLDAKDWELRATLLEMQALERRLAPGAQQSPRQVPSAWLQESVQQYAPPPLTVAAAESRARQAAEPIVEEEAEEWEEPPALRTPLPATAGAAVADVTTAFEEGVADGGGALVAAADVQSLNDDSGAAATLLLAVAAEPAGVSGSDAAFQPLAEAAERADAVDRGVDEDGSLTGDGGTFITDGAAAALGGEVAAAPADDAAAYTAPAAEAAPAPVRQSSDEASTRGDGASQGSGAEGTSPGAPAANASTMPQDLTGQEVPGALSAADPPPASASDVGAAGSAEPAAAAAAVAAAAVANQPTGVGGFARTAAPLGGEEEEGSSSSPSPVLVSPPPDELVTAAGVPPAISEGAAAAVESRAASQSPGLDLSPVNLVAPTVS